MERRYRVSTMLYRWYLPQICTNRIHNIADTCPEEEVLLLIADTANTGTMFSDTISIVFLHWRYHKIITIEF